MIARNLKNGRRLQSKGILNQELFSAKAKIAEIVVVLTEYNISRSRDSHHPLSVKMKMSEKKIPGPHQGQTPRLRIKTALGVAPRIVAQKELRYTKLRTVNN